MARLLLRRKSSMKPNIKPIPIVKKPIPKPGVEFRWSKTAAQYRSPETDSLMNFHVVELNSSQRNAFFSSPSATGKFMTFVLLNSLTDILYLARNSAANGLPLSIEKYSPRSPRLPNINGVNKKKELFISTKENNNGHINPLSLSYSQLHHAQYPSQTKKMSQAQYSIYPLINDKRNNLSVVNNGISLSSKNQQQLTNDKYIRLEISELRRLHVSKKYLKEAKTLYFNAASKVFVPRHAIVQAS